MASAARRISLGLTVLAVAAALALAGAPAAQAVPSVSYKCTPAPVDCSGWFRSDVRIDWTVIPSDADRTGCQDKVFTTDTAGTSEYCSASDGPTVTVELRIKRDATPPVVTGGSPSRSADVNGWYNRAVVVGFSGADATSGIARCTRTTYGGPDGATRSVSGTCIDRAGNTSRPFGYGLRYDATGPVVTRALPERAPDFMDWFNHAVRFDVFGADATSGVTECPPVVYEGPDGAGAAMLAACRDRAGNVTTRRFGLRFDASAPVPARPRAAPADRRIDVKWRQAPDVTAVQVMRSPGLDSAPESLVFSGPGSRFRDREVSNGRRYTYSVRLADAAGNVGTASVSTTAGPRLISPAAAAVRTPGRSVRFRWTPVRRASYYNLQLFRGGRKILSVWPDEPHYRLKRRWKHAGHSHRLRSGVYRWYVWPGFGSRRERHFGRLIGRRTLRVRSEPAGR
jgi:hypothetical protein